KKLTWRLPMNSARSSPAFQGGPRPGPLEPGVVFLAHLVLPRTQAMDSITTIRRGLGGSVDRASRAARPNPAASADQEASAADRRAPAASGDRAASAADRRGRAASADRAASAVDHRGRVASVDHEA